MQNAKAYKNSYKISTQKCARILFGSTRYSSPLTTSGKNCTLKNRGGYGEVANKPLIRASETPEGGGIKSSSNQHISQVRIIHRT